MPNHCGHPEFSYHRLTSMILGTVGRKCIATSPTSTNRNVSIFSVSRLLLTIQSGLQLLFNSCFLLNFHILNKMTFEFVIFLIYVCVYISLRIILIHFDSQNEIHICWPTVKHWWQLNISMDWVNFFSTIILTQERYYEIRKRGG